MLKTILSTSVVASILLMNTAQAEDSQFAVTGKLGTLGIGADLTYRINNKFNTRFNFNGGNIDADGDEDGIKYQGELDAQTIGGLVDYYPMGGKLRLSAGLYSNGNKLNLDTASSNGTVAIGNANYDISNAKLNTKVDFKSVAPYLGLGWGNAVKMGSKWSFNVDAGVLFQGAPEAKLTPSGSVKDSLGNTILLTDPIFTADIQREENNLNDDLKNFKAYPVISLGVGYHF